MQKGDGDENEEKQWRERTDVGKEAEDRHARIKRKKKNKIYI